MTLVDMPEERRRGRYTLGEGDLGFFLNVRETKMS